MVYLSQLTKIFNFIYLNGIIFYFSWFVCQFFIKPKTRVDYVINLTAIFYVTINLMITVLGIFGLISNLEITVILTFILCFLVYKHKKLTPQKIDVPQLFLEKHNFFNLSSFVFIFSLICFMFFILLFCLNSLKYGQISFDASYFYLPSVIHWLQSGVFQEWPEANLYVRYIPSGYYLFVYWIISIFHRDFLIGAINPFLLLLYLITGYGLGKKLKFPSFWLILNLFSFCSMPKIGDVHNDLGIAYSFTLALYYAFFYLMENKNIYLILCSAATGICLGMKYTGLLWLLIICLLIIFCIIKVTSNIKKMFILFIQWCCVAFLFGGYWYIRNFLKTGNFIFPLKAKIFNIPLYLTNNDYAVILKRADKDVSNTLLNNISILWNNAADYISLWGMGYFLILLSSFIAIGYLLFTLLKFNKNILKKDKTKIAFCSISILSLLFFFIIPNSGIDAISLRYGFPAIILSMFTLGFFIKNRYFRIFLEIIFVINIVFGLKMITKYYIFMIIISLLICLIFAIYIRLFNFRKHIALISIFLKKGYKKKVFITAIICLAACKLLWIEDYVSKKRFSDYGYQILDKEINEGFQWIEKNTHSSYIGYFDSAFVYPLFRTDFSNKIRYLSSNNVRDFIEESKAKSIDYVFFRRRLIHPKDGHAYCGEMDERYKFAEKNPEIFRDVFRNKNVIIYKVKQPIAGIE